MILNLTGNEFNDTQLTTVGKESYIYQTKIKGYDLKMKIWDTAGQEKYRSLIPSYVRNSSIVFVVYDVSNRSSFENIPNWISFVKNIEKTIMILCANKIDLEREVETKDGEELAKKEGLIFFECSAKTNENIKKWEI